MLGVKDIRGVGCRFSPCMAFPTFVAGRLVNMGGIEVLGVVMRVNRSRRVHVDHDNLFGGLCDNMLVSVQHSPSVLHII